MCVGEGGGGSIICGTNGTLERFVIYIAKFRWGSGPWGPLGPPLEIPRLVYMCRTIDFPYTVTSFKQGRSHNMRGRKYNTHTQTHTSDVAFINYYF